MATLTGDDGANTLEGTAGADALNGLGGNDALHGLAGDDALDGGAGIDTAVYDMPRADATLVRSGSGWTASTPAQGHDTLAAIERLAFTDTHVALDLDGAAGSTAQILRALFGHASLDNPGFVGIGLSLFDGGMGYADVVALALATPEFEALAGSRSNADVVTWLYTNVVDAAPAQQDVAALAALLDNGTHTQQSLALLACQHALNTGSSEIAALEFAGIAFTPFG